MNIPRIILLWMARGVPVEKYDKVNLDHKTNEFHLGRLIKTTRDQITQIKELKLEVHNLKRGNHE